MQRKVDAVGDELGGRAHKLIDISRCDEKTLRVGAVAERRGIGDRRNADGDHRAAEVSFA